MNNSIKNNIPLLSVRLMSYNHGQFIEEAIEGILNQKTNFDFEVVIGDDFSSDNTLDVCKKYEQKFPKIIKILDRKRGDAYDKERQVKGRLFNFSNIMENCNGKYVALLDGDDYWSDECKLQKQVDFLEANAEYSFCYHDYFDVDPEGKKLPESKSHVKQDFSAIEVQKGKRILPLTICMRNELKIFPSEFFRSNNGDTFMISLLGELGKAKYLGDNIEPAGHRIHSAGFWSSKKQGERYKKSYESYKMMYTYYKRRQNKEVAASMFEHIENNLTWLFIDCEQNDSQYYGFLSQEFLYLFRQQVKLTFLKNSVKAFLRKIKSK